MASSSNSGAAPPGGGMAHIDFLFRRPAPEAVAHGLPPGPVAAGLAASRRGGRCHVSPGAPAATAQGVFFVNFVQRESFLSIVFARGSFSTKNLQPVDINPLKPD